MDNDSTHTSKAAQDFKAKNKQELMTAAVKDWQSITRKKKKHHLMMSMSTKLQAGTHFIDCKGFATNRTN